MKPIILITAGIENTNRNLIQQYCYKTYAEAVAKAGGLPLIAADDSDPEALAELADGLYLSGGNDVDPVYYGGEFKLVEQDVDRWRDEFEMKLIRLFVEKRKPIFGICRGLQILNIALGGTLHEDIETRMGLHHPMETSHMVYTRLGSDLQKMFGDSFVVNSFHHQAIDKLGEGLEVSAWTEDHIVESVVHKTLPIFAVQWHPERMTGEHPYTPVGPDQHPLFERFCRFCAKK